jgi:ABC-type cobalamin/Fe3+-siderophores transport system ATPase subunit
LHDLRDAERFCDGAIVLDAGQLVFQGAARLSGDLIREVFGVQLVALAEGRYERLRGEEGAS